MSWYRNAVWFVKGLREYGRNGYESASRHFNPADLEVNLAGRSFLVTGANSGIGKATAKEIARRGSGRPVVYLKGRTVEKVSEELACSMKAKDACKEFDFNTLFPGVAYKRKYVHPMWLVTD